MKSLFILSTVFFSLNLTVLPTTLSAAEPKQKVRTLQTKNGNKIRTKDGTVVAVKQKEFHKSLR